MGNSVAVLVLNCNGKKHLDACLSSVLDQIESNDHVYLIDNGSTDGSVDYVTKRYPQVSTIRFESNLGFALAYNRAVALVPEPIVLFLNNDVEVGEYWLASLKQGVEMSNPMIVCGSKILLYINRNIINHAGGLLTITGSGIDLDFMTEDAWRTDKARYVGCVSGASMIVPRKLFLDLGGFDPDFFAYFEDVDFCWRVWLAGHRVLLVPDSEVYHKLSSTMGPHLTPERVFLGEKNRLQALLKNLDLRRTILGIFVSGGYTIARLMLLLFNQKPAAALAILRGDRWVLLHLPRIVRKRIQIQRTRRTSDAFLLKNGMMASLTGGMKEFSRLNRLLKR
jgi:GT2 family glycosyltransferase